MAEAQEAEPIPISALQHAVYCLRQAALIHLERLWADNRLTAEGDVLHAVSDKGGRRLVKGVRRVMALAQRELRRRARLLSAVCVALVARLASRPLAFRSRGLTHEGARRDRWRTLFLRRF